MLLFLLHLVLLQLLLMLLQCIRGGHPNNRGGWGISCC